ncbi:hypothetical protein MKW92_004531 [Papaver armeniacum]|nr:hypothetical protein MKW92_004531 [Papaver armeniacum]
MRVQGRLSRWSKQPCGSFFGDRESYVAGLPANIKEIKNLFSNTPSSSLVLYFLLGLRDDFSLLMYFMLSTKLCAPALAPFKETSGVPKQSQAQHEMLNMLKPRLFL